MTEEPMKRQPAKKAATRKAVEKPKIVISLDDVGSSGVDEIVSQLEEAKKVPLVRNIGEPEKTGGSGRSIGWMALAGVVGGIATWFLWGLTESIFANDDDATRSNVSATVIVAVLLGIALVVGDTLRASAYSKLGQRIGIGLAAAIGLGLVFGFIASSLYVAGTERIIDDLLASGLDFSDDELYEQFSSRNQLNRGIAWMFVGLAAGMTVSIASLEWKRLLITGGGGLVGGFLGGYLFDLISTEDFAQIAGLLITGLSVGLVIALSEEAAKTSWIEITHGGMAGKQFILYKKAISLGSAGSADITLIKDVTMPAIAATLEKQGGVMVVSSLDANSPVFLNGVETLKAQIKDGDTLSIGKTGIRFRERGQKAVNSGIVRS